VAGGSRLAPQLGPDDVGDRSGSGEVYESAHQAEVVLRAGQQPERKPTGGGVVDGAAAGIRFGYALTDQPFVEGHVPPGPRGVVRGHPRLP
jgi:hypothetical protein